MTRLLVVEDSATQAEKLRLILEGERFDVEVAGSGEAALEKLRRARFDLVISDIMMPGMSGYDLCRKVKADPVLRDTPIMLLTSLGDPMDVIQGLESGADNFLTKPYEAAYLVSRVGSILENRALRSSGHLKVGVEIMFLGRKFAITSDKEQILGLLVSTFEDTVRKNRELEASQAELASAMAKLEAAHQELESFSYSVSHDLRAPLRGISGFSDALLEEYNDKLDETGQGYLRRIITAGKRMSDLIDDLIKLSFVGRTELRREPVNLSAVAEQAIGDLKNLYPDRRVQVDIEDGMRCTGDVQLLRIVLDNLLGNAWKFTGKSSDARIEVGSSDLDGQLDVHVTDNGAGFDPAFAAKLFSPFQRLHRGDEFPGTGIGLAIVRRIIHRHGGRVWADGQPGGGATFHFTLGR